MVNDPQGSFNKPQTESSGRTESSVSVESSLKGLQVELSETCALCLSRLLSLFNLASSGTRGLEQAGQPDVVPVPAHTDQTDSPSHQPLLFKLQCGLEDVNVFTLSNVAGRSNENIRGSSLLEQNSEERCTEQNKHETESSWSFEYCSWPFHSVQYILSTSCFSDRVPLNHTAFIFFRYFLQCSVLFCSNKMGP